MFVAPVCEVPDDVPLPEPDEPPEAVEPLSLTVAFSDTLRVRVPDVSVNVPVCVPAVVLLKFSCNCAPAVLFTLAADNVVEPELNPVPLTVTVVEAVRLAPVTTTVVFLLTPLVVVPKSTVLPAAGVV